MSLIGALSNKLWQVTETASGEEFKEYMIMRCQRVSNDGGYKYSVCETNDDASPNVVHLEGGEGQRDPLKEYRVVQLRLTVVNNKPYITGIKNGSDCVVRISNEE